MLLIEAQTAQRLQTSQCFVIFLAQYNVVQLYYGTVVVKGLIKVMCIFQDEGEGAVGGTGYDTASGRSRSGTEASQLSEATTTEVHCDDDA